MHASACTPWRFSSSAGVAPRGEETLSLPIGKLLEKLTLAQDAEVIANGRLLNGKEMAHVVI